MKRIVCIGQAPARPGSKHGVAGTYVRPWLYQLGLDEAAITQYFRFYALIRSFPGSNSQGHLRPTPQQVAAHRPALVRLIQEFHPDIVVPVGAMAIAEVLPMVKGTLNDTIGHTYQADPFGSLGREIPVIPWPHPSGRSTWLAANPDKVAAALALLKQELS
jgi:uracil-DNA glycosylase